MNVVGELDVSGDEEINVPCLVYDPLSYPVELPRLPCQLLEFVCGCPDSTREARVLGWQLVGLHCLVSNEFHHLDRI